MKRFARLEDLAALVGQSLASSDWIAIDQHRVDAFAEATGDRQWIHVDPARASAGPFGTPIAHGFLTLSLMPSMLASAFAIDDMRMGVNYGVNRVRFPAPVPVGSRLRAHFGLIGFEPIPGGAQITLKASVEREGSAKPVCVAELVTRKHIGPMIRP